MPPSVAIRGRWRITSRGGGARVCGIYHSVGDNGGGGNSLRSLSVNPLDQHDVYLNVNMGYHFYFSLIISVISILSIISISEASAYAKGNTRVALRTSTRCCKIKYHPGFELPEASAGNSVSLLAF